MAPPTIPCEWAVELMTLDELVQECDTLIGLRRFLAVHKTSIEELAHAFHEHERGRTLRFKQSLLPDAIDHLDEMLRLSWRSVIVGDEYEPAHLDERQLYLMGTLLELHHLRGDPVCHRSARNDLCRKMTSTGQQAKSSAHALRGI